MSPTISSLPIQSIQSALAEALTFNYYARAYYLTAHRYFGSAPFADAAASKAGHISAMIYTARNFSIPVPADTAENRVAAPESFHQAIITGIQGETAGIAMYGRLMQNKEIPIEIKKMFGSLKSEAAASHLPAFQQAFVGIAAAQTVFGDGSSQASVTQTQPAASRNPFLSQPPYATAVMNSVNPVSAALIASVLAGTATLGRSLYRVQQGKMTRQQAVARSLAVGATTTLATSLGANLSDMVQMNDYVKLAIYAGTTVGISYALISLADSVCGEEGC